MKENNNIKTSFIIYEEVFTVPGKLFYHIAAIDGKVYPSEKESLHELIQSNWKPLKVSTDRYGKDQSPLIDSAFDYEEVEGENGFQSFEAVYHENKSRFSPEIISNILKTARAITPVYWGKNKVEKKAMKSLLNLFDK